MVQQSLDLQLENPLFYGGTQPDQEASGQFSDTSYKDAWLNLSKFKHMKHPETNFAI